MSATNKLDQKLGEICVGFESDGEDERNVYISEEAIAEIKQAFIDDGWLREINLSLPAVTPYVPEPRMTGQEWYDRFEAEISLVEYTRLQGEVTAKRIALESAKKAAGIA